MCKVHLFLATGLLLVVLSERMSPQCQAETIFSSGTASPSTLLPVWINPPRNDNDDWLDQFRDAIAQLEQSIAGQEAGTAQLDKLSGLMRLVQNQDSTSTTPFNRPQRLRMDALISQMAGLQQQLSITLSNTQIKGSSGGTTLDALMDGNTGKARYDQVLERFSRQLDDYQAAIKSTDRNSFAAIGLILQADARRIIAIGSNGSVAQRNRAMILSGRYADLSQLASQVKK